jgi:hypothetical protein
MQIKALLRKKFSRQQPIEFFATTYRFATAEFDDVNGTPA